MNIKNTHEHLIELLNQLAKASHFTFKDRPRKKEIVFTFDFADDNLLDLKVSYEEDFTDALGDVIDEVQHIADAELEQERFETYMPIIASLERVYDKLLKERI